MQTGGEGQHRVLKTHTVKCVRVRQRWCWNESETGTDIIKFPNHKYEKEGKEKDKRSYK
jgi:hypothetical protein